jgi:hypothetical protein
MPTSTYTPLANLTLGSSAASVTFSSISQAYRDLILVCTGTASGNVNLGARFNSDTGSNYSFVTMYGNGSSATSASGTDTYMPITNAGYWTTANPATATLTVMDYSATDKHKTTLSRGNNSAVAVDAAASRWANTAAVTSITVIGSNANTFAAGSTFELYGIAS